MSAQRDSASPRGSSNEGDASRERRMVCLGCMMGAGSPKGTTPARSQEKMPTHVLAELGFGWGSLPPAHCDETGPEHCPESVGRIRSGRNLLLCRLIRCRWHGASPNSKVTKGDTGQKCDCQRRLHCYAQPRNAKQAR